MTSRTPEKNLRCDDVQHLLERYLDGAFDADETAAIESHLQGCASCRAARDLALDVQNGLRDLPRLEPSRPLDRRVRRQQWQGRAALAVLAAGLMAVAAGAIHWRLSQPSPDEVAQAVAETRYAFSKIAEISRDAGLAPAQESRP